MESFIFVIMAFENTIGQDNLKASLIQNIESGRTAHAQVFVGKDGFGSLAVAIDYAQHLRSATSFGACRSQKWVQTGKGRYQSDEYRKNRDHDGIDNRCGGHGSRCTCPCCNGAEMGSRQRGALRQSHWRREHKRRRSKQKVGTAPC